MERNTEHRMPSGLFIDGLWGSSCRILNDYNILLFHDPHTYRMFCPQPYSNGLPSPLMNPPTLPSNKHRSSHIFLRIMLRGFVVIPTWTPKVCKIMALMAVIMVLGIFLHTFQGLM